MSLQDCANLVARADRDRFAATMAAPVPAREVLFPLHGFALEVAKAPWASQEPMIAEMRLQFWRDVVEEAGEDRVRAHEVAAPLAGLIAGGMPAAPLLAAIDARAWDIGRASFADEAALWAYLDATGGGLVWAAAAVLGAPGAAEEGLRAWGQGAALARFLLAVPELEARGRVPLVDGRPEGVAALARQGLAALRRGAAQRARLGKLASAPMLEGAHAAGVLKRAAAEPARVAAGALEASPFAKSWQLMRRAQARRWRV